MNISELITPDRVVCRANISSKKRTLELLGELIASGQPGIIKQDVFEILIGRERLGSTGLGHGVALPHGRLQQSREATGCFVKLAKGVDFDAIDRKPVDLVFALLVPEHFTDEHLKILAYLAEMFSDKALCEQLRATTTDDALYQRLVHWKPSSSSA